MKFNDILLEIDEETCLYDLVIEQDGDFKKTNSFITALILSFFCERRASVSEIPEVYRRRGWIGNINRLVEYGSKLWLLEQQRLTNETVNKARTYIEQALEWLVEFDYLSQVTVTSSKDIDVIRENFVASDCIGVNLERDLENQALIAQIVLTIGGSEELRRNIILWQNTRAA